MRKVKEEEVVEEVEEEEDSGQEDENKEEKAETPKQLTQSEILVVAQDYMTRANELIKYARQIK